MDPEEIKVGDKINIEALVIRKLHSEEQLITCELPTGLQFHIWQRDFEALSPANGTKNADPAPKYDPNRLFRRGDKVRVITRDGRTPVACPSSVGAVCVVLENEKKGKLITLRDEEDCRLWAEFFYLELITPVEELEPYTCGRGVDECILYKNKELFAEFENPKDAARVCKMLNAEHRKELENG